MKTAELTKTKTDNVKELAPFIEQWEQTQIKGEYHYRKVKESALELGGILFAVREKFGAPGFNAFYNAVGISEKTAYNNYNLFKHKDSEFMKGLPSRKALSLISIIEDDDVKVEKDVIDFGDGIVLSLNDAAGMTKEQLVSFAQAFRKTKRNISIKEQTHKRMEAFHEGEKENLRNELKKVRAELDARQSGVENDPLDDNITEIETHIRAAKKTLMRVLLVEVNPDQESRLKAIKVEIAEFITSIKIEDD